MEHLNCRFTNPPVWFYRGPDEVEDCRHAVREARRHDRGEGQQDRGHEGAHLLKLIVCYSLLCYVKICQIIQHEL